MSADGYDRIGKACKPCIVGTYSTGGAGQHILVVWGLLSFNSRPPYPLPPLPYLYCVAPKMLLRYVTRI
jgi:hypothetical protein